MRKITVSKADWKSVRFVGIDLGDKIARFCGADVHGRKVVEGSLPMTSEAFAELLPHPCRVAIEVGTHSPWVSRVLEASGHELYIANPRKVRLIYASGRKNDKLDAEHLAKLVRLDPSLLYPVRHRGEQAQADLAVIKARCALVEARTKLVNSARGLCKSQGARLPSCSADSFANKAWEAVPQELRPALKPIFKQLKTLTKSIREYDAKVEKLADENYPETSRLEQVTGVGALTALAFILTIERAARFAKSRQVGAWLGLTPRQDQSGDSDKQLGITKQGDGYLRQLLVSCGHYILGPFGPDCDLRRHGQKIAMRGGKNAKKRAVVAVARKLAVLLHKLWVSGEKYVELGYAKQAVTAV